LTSKPVDPVRRLLLSTPLLLLTGAACRDSSTPSAPAEEPVRVNMLVDGSVAPLARALTQAWQRQHPAWFFAVNTGSTTLVEQLIRTENVDLAVVERLPNDAGMWVTDLAVDGVGVIVNVANPVQDLSIAEVREIFAGYRRSWISGEEPAAVRGAVQIVVREDGEGTRQMFDRQVMGGLPCSVNAVVMPTPETAVNYVALQPAAIAYVASGWFNPVKQPSVKMISLDGCALSVASLTDGTYPLSRNLHLVARAAPTGSLRDFVAWLHGEDARQIAQSLGYATIS